MKKEVQVGFSLAQNNSNGRIGWPWLACSLVGLLLSTEKGGGVWLAQVGSMATQPGRSYTALRTFLLHFPFHQTANVTHTWKLPKGPQSVRLLCPFNLHIYNYYYAFFRSSFFPKHFFFSLSLSLSLSPSFECCFLGKERENLGGYIIYVRMMYEHDDEEHQQQDMRKRMEKQKSIEEDERLETVDLSGMSLDSLPNPSLNLGTICKLDLSSNNLQVFS